MGPQEGKISMWGHIGKVKSIIFLLGQRNSNHPKEITLVKGPGDRVYKRSKSYMQRYQMILPSHLLGSVTLHSIL